MNGLRDYKSIFPRRRIIKNIKNLLCEVKFAVQRAWRGYDDSMIWNFDEYIYGYLYIVVDWYLHNSNGYPMIGDDEKLSKELWFGILKTIKEQIEIFRADDFNDCYYTDEQGNEKFDIKKWLDIEKGKDVAKDTVNILLMRYMHYMWD